MEFVENQHVELKENHKSGTIVNEIVAFLNTCDGTIYLGVKDDGTVLGISKMDEAMLKVSDIITNQILPAPEEFVDVDSPSIDGKTIIEIKVRKGRELYYVRKYGRSSAGCYKRVGTSARGMSEHEIYCAMKESIISKTDICEIPSRQATFSFRELSLYYVSKGFRLNEETMERSLKLKTEEGRYNLLAELLSDENRVSIKIARFRGTDKSELDEKSEYGYQCLIRAIDRMMDRLEAENYAMSMIGKATRADKRLMDMACLREAFINAIAHNDWTICEPAVYVFSDRIEIFSYGGLPYGQTKEMFFKGASNPRNASLMRILGDLEYVEQTGHGIPEIISHYGKEAFDVNDHYINVIIPFDKEVMENRAKSRLALKNGTQLALNNGTQLALNDGTQLALNDGSHPSFSEKELKKLIKSNEKITRKEIAEYFGLSPRTIQRYMNQVKSVRYVGSGKSGRWEIKK